MARTDDMPSATPLTGRVILDSTSNIFLKDVNIPESYVVVEKSVQNKAQYNPNLIPIGNQHPTLTTYFKYEESINDIGNGLFEIQTRYAKIPPTWYSYEAMNIPFTKFVGVTVTGTGPIVITTPSLFGWLNLQGIQDVRDFDENAYASTEQKQGTINCVVRTKHEYASVTYDQVKNGSVSPFSIQTADYEEHPLNGDTGVIDDPLTFTFTNAAPSSPIKFEAGKYVGNIYVNRTFEIVSNFVI